MNVAPARAPPRQPSRQRTARPARCAALHRSSAGRRSGGGPARGEPGLWTRCGRGRRAGSRRRRRRSPNVRRRPRLLGRHPRAQSRTASSPPSNARRNRRNFSGLSSRVLSIWCIRSSGMPSAGKSQGHADVVHAPYRDAHPKGDERGQARDRQPPAQRFRQPAGLVFRQRDGPGCDLDIVGRRNDAAVDGQRPEVAVGSAGHSQAGVHEGIAGRFEACPRFDHLRVLGVLFAPPITARTASRNPPSRK